MRAAGDRMGVKLTDSDLAMYKVALQVDIAADAGDDDEPLSAEARRIQEEDMEQGSFQDMLNQHAASSQGSSCKCTIT